MNIFFASGNLTWRTGTSFHIIGNSALIICRVNGSFSIAMSNYQRATHPNMGKFTNNQISWEYWQCKSVIGVDLVDCNRRFRARFRMMGVSIWNLSAYFGISPSWRLGIFPDWWFGTMDFFDFPETVGNVIIPTFPKSIIFRGGVGQPPSRLLLTIINHIVNLLLTIINHH